MAYNEILYHLRKEKGKTRKEVAEAIGVSQSSIAMYERGERKPPDKIKEAFASYYKKSITAIFFAK